MNAGAFSIRFKLFGIPIAIAPTFFLLGLLFYQWNTYHPNPVLATAEIMIWVLIAVLVHEMGHALVLRYFGLQPTILLYMIGGRASWKQEVGQPLTNGQHIVIALAGPAAGFLLGGLVWVYVSLLNGPLPAFAIEPGLLYSYIIYFTVYWSILNLLPMYPLDGGQVMYYALNQHPRWNARMLTSIITLILGGGLIILSIWAGEIWASLLLGFIILNNYRMLQSSRDQQLNKRVEVVKGLLAEHKYDEAITQTKEILHQAKSEPYRNWAIGLLARIYALKGDWEAATELGKTHRELEDILPEVKIFALMQTEGVDSALETARKALSLRPSFSLASINVGLLAREKRYEEIQEWLQMTRSQPFYENLVEYVKTIMQQHEHRPALKEYPNLARWLELAADGNPSV